MATEQGRQEIQRAIDRFGLTLNSVRDSLHFAAPEAQDFHWQRIADASVSLVNDVLDIVEQPSADQDRAEKGD